MGHKLLAMISMHVEDLKIRVSMYVNISKRYSFQLTKPYSPRHLLQDYQMYPGEIDKVCATDDDRPAQKAMVYTVTQCDNIRSQPYWNSNMEMHSLHTYHLSTSSSRSFAGPIAQKR